ncbi:hypothetical protein ACIRG5_42540 [Lentzea sp. NPDC102401]
MSHRLDLEPLAGLDLAQLSEAHDTVLALLVFLLLPLLVAITGVTS